MRWKNPGKLEDELERRRRYRDRLVERRADGSTGGVDPHKVERAVLAEVHPPAPILDAIREKCLDCCVYQPSEVDRCTAVACSLWPYRFGSNPFAKARGGGNPEGLRRAREALAKFGGSIRRNRPFGLLR